MGCTVIKVQGSASVIKGTADRREAVPGAHPHVIRGGCLCSDIPVGPTVRKVLRRVGAVAVQRGQNEFLVAGPVAP